VLKAKKLSLACIIISAVCFPLPTLLAENSGGETHIEIEAIAGLRFSPPRFTVAPGAMVKLTVENADDMAHNLVITAPGARAEIVNAAMTMPITPTSNFIPETDKVLHHTPVLNPKTNATLSFKAPVSEGVYPYVCTYPGHGQIMYGAMYVTKKSPSALPALAKDENLPEMVRSMSGAAKLHAYSVEPPAYYRIFMRDSGPASVAVALPNQQNFCWDTDACRLRYAWTGGFVDPMPHWTGNGDGMAEVLGRIYYRAPQRPQLRIPDQKNAKPQFRGYRLINKVPEFQYMIGDVAVRELIQPLHHGGLEISFHLENAKESVQYVIDPKSGASFTSSVGTFKDGILSLTPEQAKKFTISLTALPGYEPLGYWSMNDTPNGKKAGIVDAGVQGRANSFDGKKQEIDTGISTDALSSGCTIAIWVKGPITKGKGKGKDSAPEPTQSNQVIIGGKNGDDEFTLGWGFDDQTGYCVVAKTAGGVSRISAGQPPDLANWHHLAVTYGPSGFVFYVDGQRIGAAAGKLPPGLRLYIGSNGEGLRGNFIADETRLDDREYSAVEIAELFKSGQRALIQNSSTTPSKEQR
jgi:plastocyanin